MINKNLSNIMKEEKNKKDMIGKKAKWQTNSIILIITLK